jgi:ABC-type uncharacterized transport system permease subunit
MTAVECAPKPAGARWRLRPTLLVPLAAVVFAALVGLALIASVGVKVPDAIAAFIDGTVGSPYAIAASINRSIAFSLVGFGFVLANRANLTNVGGEGQIAVGGIVATAVALYGHVAALPLGLAFILPMLAAVVAGAAWGTLAAVMKVKAGTNEVISTLLLSFIGVWLLYWCVQSPALLRKPMTTSATLPESLEIPDATKLPLLTGDYSFPVHIGLPVTIAIAIVVAVLLSRTVFGRRPGRACRRVHAARRAIHPQGRLFVGLWLRRPGRRAPGARLGDRRRRGIAAIRLHAIGRDQHGDGRRRTDRAGGRHPGPDRHHARRRDPVHRAMGTAMRRGPQ